MQFTDWSVNFHIALKAMFYLLNDICPSNMCNSESNLPQLSQTHVVAKQSSVHNMGMCHIKLLMVI